MAVVNEFAWWRVHDALQEDDTPVAFAVMGDSNTNQLAGRNDFRETLWSQLMVLYNRNYGGVLALPWKLGASGAAVVSSLPADSINPIRFTSGTLTGDWLGTTVNPGGFDPASDLNPLNRELQSGQTNALVADPLGLRYEPLALDVDQTIPEWQISTANKLLDYWRLDGDGSLRGVDVLCRYHHRELPTSIATSGALTPGWTPGYRNQNNDRGFGPLVSPDSGDDTFRRAFVDFEIPAADNLPTEWMDVYPSYHQADDPVGPILLDGLSLLIDGVTRPVYEAALLLNMGSQGAPEYLMALDGSRSHTYNGTHRIFLEGGDGNTGDANAGRGTPHETGVRYMSMIRDTLGDDGVLCVIIQGGGNDFDGPAGGSVSSYLGGNVPDPGNWGNPQNSAHCIAACYDVLQRWWTDAGGRVDNFCVLHVASFPKPASDAAADGGDYTPNAALETLNATYRETMAPGGQHHRAQLCHVSQVATVEDLWTQGFYADQSGPGYDTAHYTAAGYAGLGALVAEELQQAGLVGELQGGGGGARNRARSRARASRLAQG